MSKSAGAVVRAVTPEDIDGFHRALDSVSRERKYLTFLEAPPLEEFGQFVLSMAEEGNPQFVAVVDEELAGATYGGIFSQPTPTVEVWGWESFGRTANEAWVFN